MIKRILFIGLLLFNDTGNQTADGITRKGIRPAGGLRALSKKTAGFYLWALCFQVNLFYHRFQRRQIKHACFPRHFIQIRTDNRRFHKLKKVLLELPGGRYRELAVQGAREHKGNIDHFNTKNVLTSCFAQKAAAQRSGKHFGKQRKYFYIHTFFLNPAVLWGFLHPCAAPLGQSLLQLISTKSLIGVSRWTLSGSGGAGRQGA